MHAIGIPRLDAGDEGIYLLWTWPNLLPLSERGYDIQRREASDARQPRCETIDQPILDTLGAVGEYPAPLGPLRLRRGVTLPPLLPGPSEAQAQKVAEGCGQVNAYIQELTTPTNRVTMSALTDGVAGAVALFEGKAVAAARGEQGFDVTRFDLRAPAIDTVVLYSSLVSKFFEICVFDLPDAQSSQAQWHGAPIIVKGLTLPIAEADPTLTTSDAEFNAAKARLVGGEPLAKQDFAKLAATLRQPAAGAALGRSGERVVLVRAKADQAYEELAFEGQLAALSLHPKLRRLLGFGFADRTGLTPGHTYVYRITGHFHADDLYDDIYDVHLVPAATPLPAAFTIRDLSVRLQKPAKVVLDPPPPEGLLLAASRRGIRIDSSGFNASFSIPSFGAWSAVFDLPRPVTDLVLEVAAGHSFTYAGGDRAAFPAVAPAPLPAGPRVALHFVAPITELRLAGTGTLFALRLPSGRSGLIELYAETAPIPFAAQPLPAPPLNLTAASLQTPPAPLIGAIDDSTKVPPRPPLGIKLSWLPAVAGGLTAWPNDLAAGPPLEGIAYQIQHRRTEVASPWENIQGDDNLVLGSRDATEPVVRLTEGMDLDEVFARLRRRPVGAGSTLHLSDAFGEKDPTTGAVRPAQPSGTMHQYQIRAMDAAGRVSAAWTPSNVVRLEKRLPPPLPTGPQPPPKLSANNHLTAPPGPRARALVAGAKGLTPAEKQLLGAHANAIVLHWGWRQQERDLDPTTAEFRLYVAPPLDTVRGTITTVASAPPNWDLALTCDPGVSPLAADECAGQWITTGGPDGYPFRVLHHGAGGASHLVVEPALARPGVAPVLGPVVFGRPLQPAHQRPAGWGKRVAVVPLTAQDSYRHIFYDLLSLSPAQPSDALWVGVAAADKEAYVADELGAGPNAPRPGNESSIAACAVAARYQGQPVFSRPAPVGDVPELVTEEPTGRQVLVALDLAALLGGALPAGSLVALERCATDDVLSRLSVDSAGHVILADADGKPQTISFPTPADQAAVVATLRSSDPRKLANRYFLYLLAHAAQPESFFARVSGQTLPVAPIDDRLPPRPGRFFYRVRAADTLGDVSDGSAILPLAVRVPSTTPAVAPRRRSLTATRPGATPPRVALAVEIPADPDTSHVLLFAAITPTGTVPGNPAAAELLRLPNRRDLYPQGGGLRLQLADGSLLAPTAVQALVGPGVVTDPGGARLLTLKVPAAHGAWVTLWCYGLTDDGFPSAACGPFGIGVS